MLFCFRSIFIAMTIKKHREQLAGSNQPLLTLNLINQQHVRKTVKDVLRAKGHTCMVYILYRKKKSIDFAIRNNLPSLCGANLIGPGLCFSFHCSRSSSSFLATEWVQKNPNTQKLEAILKSRQHQLRGAITTHPGQSLLFSRNAYSPAACYKISREAKFLLTQDHMVKTFSFPIMFLK